MDKIILERAEIEKKRKTSETLTGTVYRKEKLTVKTFTISIHFIIGWIILKNFKNDMSFPQETDRSYILCIANPSFSK